jgi:anti-sigma regulatory factor (Ser/Thr protein kinase)
VTLVVAYDVPTSSTMAVPHGPASVGTARRRLRKELTAHRIPESVIDDASLILSELLSNACRHARPLSDRTEGAAGSGTAIGQVEVGWEIGGGVLTIRVTDGGGPTRPRRSSPSLTARGGRGLGIVGLLATEWGIDDEPGKVTVWAALPAPGREAVS